MESTSDRLPSARPCMCVCPTSLVCSLWLNSASPEPCKHFILGGPGVDSWQKSCETNEKNGVFLHEGALFLMVDHTKGDKGALRPPKPCCQGAFLRRRAGGERLSAMAGQARPLRSARLVLPAPAAPTCPRGGGGGAAGSRRDKVDSRKVSEGPRVGRGRKGDPGIGSSPPCAEPPWRWAKGCGCSGSRSRGRAPCWRRAAAGTACCWRPAPWRRSVSAKKKNK